MYSYLCRFMDRRVAGVATGLWYAVLVVLVLYYVLLPAGQFRYAHW